MNKVKAGTFVTVEAPNGEYVEGETTDHVEDMGEDQFSIICSCSGDIVKVTNPWDCQITWEIGSGKKS